MAVLTALSLGGFTADAHQPWTDSCDCYFKYLIIHFNHWIIPFDFLITW